MANRYMTQFFWTFHTKPVLIDCNIAIGSTGAVGTVKGPGVSTVTRVGVGTYKIKLQDNYNRFYGLDSWFESGVSGSNVTAGSFSVGVTYQITAVGTTNWTAIGLAAGLTAAVGQSFVATGVGSGTGTAKILAPSGIVAVEVAGDPNLMNPASSSSGMIINVTCYAATSSSVTTLIPADPANGCLMGLSFYLSSSSVMLQGE